MLPDRLPAPSVQPPMTTSWVRTFLILIHASLRLPSRYGAARRFAMTPSSPASLVGAEDVLASHITERICRGKGGPGESEPLELRPALVVGIPEKRVTVEMKEIKDHVTRWRCGALLLDRSGIRHMEAVLQTAEVGDPIWSENDDLSVQHARP